MMFSHADQGATLDHLVNGMVRLSGAHQPAAPS
jgi:hypothetical protein